MNSQMREEVVFKVQLTDLSLQDSLYQLGTLTEDKHRIFSNKQDKIRPYEFVDRVQM